MGLGRLPGGSEVRAGVRRTSSETRVACGIIGHVVGAQCQLWFKSCLSCSLRPVTLAEFLNLTKSWFPSLNNGDITFHDDIPRLVLRLIKDKYFGKRKSIPYMRR